MTATRRRASATTSRNSIQCCRKPLVQMAMGTPAAMYNGGMLQAHLRYFDPQHHRPGLPEHVAALVDRVSADQVSVSLVNTDPVEGRAVLLQAGSFGEHCFTRARLETREGADQPVEVGGKYLRVHLGPGAQHAPAPGTAAIRNVQPYFGNEDLFQLPAPIGFR